MAHYLISIILLLIGIFIFGFGFKRMNTRKIIQDTPSSKIRSMAIGLVEISGKAFVDKYLISPFSQSKCVYYKILIKEYRHVDKSSNWITIDEKEQRIPFWLKDETGQVTINPTGSEISVPVKNEYIKHGEGVNIGINGIHIGVSKPIDYSNLTPIDPHKDFFVNTRNGDRRFYEHYIGLGEQLFITGTAATDPKTPGNIVIKEGDIEKTFIISDTSQKDLLKAMTLQTIALFACGALLMIAGVIVILT